METGISPPTGFEPSVAAAIEVAALFGLEEESAREEARAMAKIVASQWRGLLQRQKGYAVFARRLMPGAGSGVT